MAPKGGSLLGKADSTLATMSYREAMADVMPDYGEVYGLEAATQAMFQKGVEDHFNTLHADYNALGDELKETTTTMMADLSAGTTVDEVGMEMFNSELNKLRQRLKATPKGKKGELERAKIRAELGRLKNSTEGMDETLTTLGTMIENDQFDILATGQDLPLLLAISKGVAKKKIVNGNLVYSIPNPTPGGEDIVIDQQQLKEAVVLKDPEFASNFNKIHAGFNALGKQKGTSWGDKRQGAVNDYEKIFTTKHTFAATINNKQGDMEYSFLQSLTGKGDNTIIYETLMEMGNKENFFNGYDADKDGDVDADDFTHPTNGAKLINALTNIKDKENFDFQTAKKVAAEFYADNLAKSEFDDGTKLRTVDKTDDVTEGDWNVYNLGKDDIKIGISKGYGKGTYRDKMTPEVATVLLDKVETGVGFTFQDKNYNYLFNKDGVGNWYEFEEGEKVKDIEQGDLIGGGSDLESSIFRTMHPAFQKLKTTRDQGEQIEGFEETPETTPLSLTSNISGTKLTNDIFDKREGKAGPLLQELIGNKYEIDERVGGRDVLRIRTIAGDPINIVEVEKNDEGKWVPQTNADGSYKYKKRIQTDIAVGKLWKKQREMMSFYYTFADPKSDHYDESIFSTDLELD